MKFAELERLFVKISQKRRFPGVYLGCRLEVRRSPRLIFVQSGENYRRIRPWGAQTAGDALSTFLLEGFTLNYLFLVV
jgi:hypothetical protein